MRFGFRQKTRLWKIETPTLARHDSVSRVTAIVDGEPLWFESSDTELAPAPEAFASLLFIPALFSGYQFESAAPLDKTWLSNTSSLTPILHKWWQTKDEYPVTNIIRKAAGVAVQKRGLCYSGGVDSLYEFIMSQSQIDALVFVHGFDIDADDQSRMDACNEKLQQIGGETNKQVVVVRTNARKHHVFGSFDWERTHGAALAAVGHVLAQQIGRLRIAASWSYSADQPWGSHWDTDPLWSATAMQIEHADATHTRQEKIKKIANNPLAQKYMRVCWENLSSSGNCCRCAKCVRTMLSFHACGTLDRFECFPERDNLAGRLDAIPYLSKALHGPARMQLNELTDPELHAAMARLLQRKRRKGLRRWFA